MTRQFLNLFILFFLCLNHSFGQFGIKVIPEVTFMNIEESSDNESSGINVGFSVNPMYEFKLLDNFSVISGIAVSLKTYTKKQILIFGTDIMDGTTSELKANHFLNAFEIPIQLKYTIPSGKFFFSVGGAYKRVLSDSASGKVFLGNGNIDRLTQVDFVLTDNNWVGIASFGFSFPLNEKIKLSIEPVFRYDFLKNKLFLTKNEANYFSVGGAFGIHFNKTKKVRSLN